MGVQISTSVSIIDSLFGFQAVSLTAFDTASVPSIAAGSKVEIAGAFFSFTSDESINATSWTAISTGDTAYITLTPAGTAGTQTVTAEWTSTAPTWSDSKQAYYASAASNIRVIGRCVKDGTAGSEYTQKWVYGMIQRNAMNQDVQTTDDVEFNSISISAVTEEVEGSVPLTEPQFFALLSPYVPDVGDKVYVTGFIAEGGISDELWFITSMERLSTTLISFGPSGVINPATPSATVSGRAIQNFSSSATFKYNIRFL